MFGRHSHLKNRGILGEETLDEIEGEALVVLEHPDRYPVATVSAARQALDRVRGLRAHQRQAPLLRSA